VPLSLGSSSQGYAVLPVRDWNGDGVYGTAQPTSKDTPTHWQLSQALRLSAPTAYHL
jgi:hypothetical protein